MTPTHRSTHLRMLVRVVISAACLGACSINPQPLPPDSPDSSSLGKQDATPLVVDSGDFDAKNTGSTHDTGPDIETSPGTGKDGGRDGAVGDGGTDAAEAGLADVESDAVSEAAPEAGSSGGDASDTTDAETP